MTFLPVIFFLLLGRGEAGEDQVLSLKAVDPWNVPLSASNALPNEVICVSVR